jgi:hypothetical protein
VSKVNLPGVHVPEQANKKSFFFKLVAGLPKNATIVQVNRRTDLKFFQACQGFAEGNVQVHKSTTKQAYKGTKYLFPFFLL